MMSNLVSNAYILSLQIIQGDNKHLCALKQAIFRF